MCDRANNRIQVFNKDGTFAKEFQLDAETLQNGSVWDLVLSNDAAQRYIFVADGANMAVSTLDRQTGKRLGMFGRPGRMAGELKWIHHGSRTPGLTCDSSGPNAFKNVVAALRARFGANNLVTAAITADGTSGGKIDATDYAGAMPNLNWIMPMTYDYFGAFNPHGPTAPHSPLNSYAGIPTAGFYADAAIQKLKSKGMPASKMLLGIGFYGRGWTGVTQAGPGGSATGPGAGHVRTGKRGLQGAQGPLPDHRHGRRHRLRQVRQRVVGLRQPGHDRRQDGLRQRAGSRRRVLLGAVRRHRQR